MDTKTHKQGRWGGNRTLRHNLANNTTENQPKNSLETQRALVLKYSEGEEGRGHM